MAEQYANELKALRGKKSDFNFFSWLGDKIGGLWNDFTGVSQNNANLAFQQENLDYQKALQQKIFAREDTAYQRTVRDMRLAGLNPISMQGSNSSGEAVATTPIESSKTSDIQALSQIMNVISQLNVNRNNNSVSQAQSNLINAQAENQRIKNIYESDILSETLNQLNYSNIGKRFQNERDNIAWLEDINNFAFNRQFGLSNNMPNSVKFFNILTHQGKLKEDFYKGFQRDWNDSFGKTFNYFDSNPDFNNLESLFEKLNLSGSINESKIANALLKLLGIGF